MFYRLKRSNHDSAHGAISVMKLGNITTDEQRLELWQNFESSGSTNDLGIFMHAFQDKYSHDGYDYKTGHLFIRHPESPDLTYWDSASIEKANLMAEATYDMLKEAIGIMAKKGTVDVKYPPVPYSKLISFVHRFNAADNVKDKNKALNEMKEFIAKYRQEQSNIIRIAELDLFRNPKTGKSIKSEHSSVKE
jgi:hypothetical protein